MNVPPTLARYLLLSIFMLGSLFVQGQSIGKPTVSGTPVCAGSTVTISFQVTNGTAGTRGFTTNTTYTVLFGTREGGSGSFQEIHSFRPSNAPQYVANASAIITQSIPIPFGITGRNDYRIAVRSEDPVQNHTTLLGSDNFQVGEVASTADQNNQGDNEWIGHIYNDRFGTYLGRYTRPALFDENFGNSNCFNFSYNGQAGVVNTETFSVRYRMRSSLKGMYTVSIGSDDGSRLSVDGTEVYNHWSDHGYFENQNILISLSGNSNLILDYYENSGDNRISITNAVRVIENSLTQNTSQTISLGNTGSAISGDTFGNLPAGITRTGTGYQWFYSTSEGGAKIAISGATGATYTPSTTSAPFNTPGNYYLFRQTRLSSTNNRLASYNATDFSNAAVLNVQSGVEITSQPNNKIICSGTAATFSVIATGSNLQYQWQRNDGPNTGYFNIDNGSNFNGTKTANLTVSGASWLNDRSFRVIITSSSGVTKTSNSAIVNIKEGPGWINQPNNQTVCVGQNSSFTTQSFESTYQWQVSSNAGASWINISNNSTYSNVTAETLNISNVTAAMNNYLYRAKISRNGCDVYGSPATLSVNTLPVITSQPINQSVPVGANAVFTGTATGNGLIYNWETKSTGNWYPIMDDETYSGTTTNQLTVRNVQEWQNSYSFRMKVTNNSGCTVTSNEAILTTLSGPCEGGEGTLNNQDDQSIAATDSWRGHVYNETNLSTYIGYYNEPENFDQNFGGDANCFGIIANSNPSSIYTETFSVRYRMNSTKTGLYVVNLGSDDGSRLRVDGNLVYNNWVPQSYSVRTGTLLSLSGNSQLEYEFFEQGGGNRVSFTNLTRVLENKLSGNIEQSICPGSSAVVISGDTFGTLPNGLSNASYQWTYSTSVNGPRTDISGANTASFTPNVNNSPFNQPGTYYIYRNTSVTSTNNVGYNTYRATHESNAATLEVNAQISNNEIIYGETGTVCATVNENGNLNLSAPEGTVFTSVDFASYGTPNGTCENFTLGTCHATTSQAVVEGYLLGNNSASIPATNAVFGDPCNGTVKRLYVQATYAKPMEPVCSGTDPGTISGSTPQSTGEDINYSWQVSTTGPDSGFSEAPGRNELQDYNPGPLEQTTWFKRNILFANCDANDSNVVEITVLPLPTITLNAPEDICGSQTVSLTGSFSGTGPWTVNASLNGSAPFSYNIAERNYNFPIEITETSTIEILQVTDNGTSCTNNAPEASVTITLYESVANNTIERNQSICGISTAETLTGNNAGENIDYLWEMSTSGAQTGFLPATGNNTDINYSPGDLTQTTWFRRKATSGVCAVNISNVVEVSVYSIISDNQVTYSGESETVCSGSSPLKINGSQPTGGNGEYTYLWESKESVEGNFVPATGTNNSQNYTPTLLRQTTWFRRTVSSGSCESNTSNEVKITVNPLPTVTISGETSICRGETVNLTGNFTGVGPWTVNVLMGNTPYTFNVPQDQSTYAISVTPTNTTTYTVTGVTDANGCFNDEDVSVTVNVSQEITWTGAQDTNWNNTANWSCNILPDLDIDVRIQSGLTNYPVLNTGANGLCRDLIIEDQASVEVQNNWLRIAGDFSNSGRFNSQNGSLAFVGNTSQLIPTGALENNRIQNLTVNNNSGVTSEAVIEVTGILKVENGNFETGNQLTLISNEVQTALIDGAGNGEVTGLVDMQRFIDNSFGYKYFSSPFQYSTVGDFGPYINFSDPVSGFPNFYRYNENRRLDSLNVDATGWEVYTTTSSPLNEMEGYAINFGEITAPVNVELTGEVNNGYFSRNMSNHNREYTRGFHLIGNPYPSPIDWDASTGWTKTNIDNGIYFFTAGDSSRYTGTYTSYVNGISSTDGKSSNIIPSMQGFFVKVSDSNTDTYPVNGTLGMSNEVRIVDFQQEFLKTRIREEKQLLRLTAGFANSEDTDAMVVYFSNLSNTDFEKTLDAHKLMNTDTRVPNLYSISSDQKDLSINALPFPEYGSYKKIPLGITTEKSGNMKIKLTKIQNLPLNFNVYLIDKEKKMGQNLTRNPVYSFSIGKGENNSRFQLMFSEEEITDPAIAFDELFSVQNDFGNVMVRLNLKDGQKGILRASTVTGQILEIKEGYGQEEVEFTAITSTGVYFITLYVGDQRISKKILINK